MFDRGLTIEQLFWQTANVRSMLFGSVLFGSVLFGSIRRFAPATETLSHPLGRMSTMSTTAVIPVRSSQVRTSQRHARRAYPVQSYPVQAHHRQQYAVVVPSRLAAPRTAASRPTTQVYVRRRLLVVLVLVAVVAAVWMGAGDVVANRGGDPASASAVRPVAAQTYIVQPGDTMWSIARVHHGERSLSDYVDLLIEHNGGTLLQIGQQVVLP